MVNVNVNAVYNTAVYSLLKSRDPTHLQKQKITEDPLGKNVSKSFDEFVNSSGHSFSIPKRDIAKS